MSKLKMKDILELTPVVTKIVNEENVSGAAKLKSADLVEPFQKKVELFEKERRNIVVKYGEKQGDRDEYKVAVDKIDDYSKEIDEMLEVEYDITETKFTKEELKLDVTKLTGLDLAALKKFGLLD